MAGRNEERRDERALEREIEVRRLERRQRLEDRSHDFQRSLLLDLQDALQDLIRVTAKVVFYDTDKLKATGQAFQLGRQLNEESYNAGVSVRKLMGRILDSDLRSRIESFHGQCSGRVEALHVLHKGDPRDLVDALNEYLYELTQSYSELSECLGRALRFELGPPD